MKKLFAVGATAALMLAATSPATAQAIVTDDGDDGNFVQVVDASQAQFAVAAQFGDANAAADDGSVALASNDLSITQNQVNGGLGGFFFVH